MAQPVIAPVAALTTEQADGISRATPLPILGVELGTIINKMIAQQNAIAAVLNAIVAELEGEHYAS